MSIWVIGINHKTAPIALREQIYFPAEKLSLYLQDILTRGLANEALLLSTCNRSELYCETDDIEPLLDWFCAQQETETTDGDFHALREAVYAFNHIEAITHIMAVACGLDSMILGETQILGQMKEAFSESCTAGAINSLFHKLFQQVFSIAKEIRTTTAIGACPVSVASAAVHFAKQQFAGFAAAHIVLIGAGDTASLLRRHLQSHTALPITIVNRNCERALHLVNGNAGYVYHLDNLEEALLTADIVFSATGSPQPLLTKNMMTSVMARRQQQPIVLIDVAVPRDIDAAVAEVAQVALYCIDDLKAIIATNRKGREHAAEKAKDVIRIKSEELMTELELHAKVAHTIRGYRNQIEHICRQELIKAKQRLQQGADPSQVLDSFAAAFTKKILHNPSVKLRQAGMAGHVELLKFAKQFFAISDLETEVDYL